MGELTIVGRKPELGAIEGLIDELSQGPTALVLAGEAGIGKTILWQAGIDWARPRGVRVLSCHGVAPESTLSFAGLSELVTPVLEETLHCLASPRRRALEVALLLAEPGDVPPNVHAVGLAVLGVIQEMAGHGAVLLAIDDLQWLDPATAEVVQFALRRLQAEPVGLLCTVREEPGIVVPIELDRCLPETRLSRIRIGPLALGAIHELVRDRTTLDPSRPELIKLHETTGGNAFYALELARELSRVGRHAHIGEPLPVPDALANLLGGRLERLSDQTRDVLLAAALAARPTVDLLIAARGDRAAVIASIDEAVDEAVISDVDGRVRFAHPLIASVLQDRASTSRRRSVHRALAAAVDDLEERARHDAKAAAGPDARVAAELEAAADLAAARGATSAGAELYELAAQLDPADGDVRTRRLLNAAKLHRLAGDGEHAVALLDQLLAVVPAGVQRSDVLFELAMTFRVDTRRMIELCDQALLEAGGDDARSARILANRTEARMWGGDVQTALADAQQSLERAEHVGDPALIAIAITRIGIVEAYAGELTPGLLERGVDLEDRFGLVLDYYESPKYGIARLWMRQGDLERSRRVIDEMEQITVARGDERSRVMVLWVSGMLDWFAGRLLAALEIATEARVLAHQTQLPHGLIWVGRLKALVEADLGHIEQARASAREGLAFAESAGNEFFTIVSLGSLGRAELALGNAEQAAHFLRDLPARLLAGGINDPTVPAWADAIEALVRRAEIGLACDYLERYETHAQRLSNAWALSGAARCRGLVNAARGDLEGGIAAAQDALTVLRGFEYPLERGRANLVLGSLHRQAQHKGAARTNLGEAIRLFEGIGARPWAELARAQLRRISGRRPSPSDLTESEHVVARFAAQGLSNKEIAVASHMAISTVEAHLSRVYRKLGVGRAGLAGRLLEPVEQVKPMVDPAQT